MLAACGVAEAATFPAVMELAELEEGEEEGVEVADAVMRVARLEGSVRSVFPSSWRRMVLLKEPVK